MTTNADLWMSIAGGPGDLRTEDVRTLSPTEYTAARTAAGLGGAEPLMPALYDSAFSAPVAGPAWADQLYGALATACGGYSQVPLPMLAAAAWGQRNNGGGHRPGRTLALALLRAAWERRWSEGDGWPTDPVWTDEHEARLASGWPDDDHELDTDGPMPAARIDAVTP